MDGQRYASKERWSQLKLAYHTAIDNRMLIAPCCHRSFHVVLWMVLQVGDAISVLGLLLLTQRNLSEAEAALKHALRLQRAGLGSGHARTATTGVVATHVNIVPTAAQMLSWHCANQAPSARHNIKLTHGCREPVPLHRPQLSA